MRIRTGPLWRAVVILCMGMGLYLIYQRAAGWVERRMPNLADKPMQLAKAQLQNAWNIPAKDFHAMTVKRREGAIMGRVRANCWRAAGRIYYQVRGPESPADVTNGNDTKIFVFCEAEYRAEQSHKVERFMLSGATKLWKFHDRGTARSIVAAGRYKIERESGHITLTFWTPQREPVETIRFCYREDGQEGHIDFRPYQWPIAKHEPRGSLQ